MIKKLLNKNILGRITKIFVFVFIAYFLTYGTAQYLAAANLENSNTLLINSINQYNQSLQDVQEEDNTVSTDIPLFNNGKDAAITAFDKLNNYATYELLSHGDFDIIGVTKLGEISVAGKLNIRAIRYDETNSYMETIKMRLSGYPVDLTRGTKVFFTDGGRYDIVTKDVYRSGNTVGATYASNKWEQNQNPKTTKIGLYIVNASTIRSSENFRVVYHSITKKIIKYTFDITLNPMNSTTDYAKMVYEQGGEKLPVFSSIVMSCELDREGNLIGFVSNERYTTQSSVGFYTFPAYVKNKMVYSLVSFDSAPTVTKPTI